MWILDWAVRESRSRTDSVRHTQRQLLKGLLLNVNVTLSTYLNSGSD